MSFPNVPNVPGVPPLARDPLVVASVIAWMVVDAVTFSIAPFAPQWGIYKNGISVVAADNVVTFDYKRDWSISDYQIEAGSFASYDKVEHPADIRLRFSRGGSDLARSAFLASLEAISGTTELFDVYTPERVYVDYNILHIDFRRAARNGLGLLTVDVWLVEIRQSATTTFSNTQNPANAGNVGAGAVQPKPQSSIFAPNLSAIQ